ncbi:MAG: hypothetical protein JST11_05410 [Acidobacteria bacterium]|nr:hypothetical protein [Acidobacteriota bacterium]
MPPLWLWPNLLSLDAPLIAVLWQDLLAWRYQVPLHPPARIALFLTVWAIYIADRVLDARRPPTAFEPARHRFYRRHRRFAVALLGVLLAATGAIAALWLRPAVLRNGLVPLAAVAVYLAAVHLGGGSRQVAKEWVVAFVFTTGTFLAAWTNDAASPLTLLAPAAAFFVLCLGNLAAIEKWEWEELRHGAEPAHPATRALVRTLRWWLPVFAAAALARARDPWYLAIGLAAAAIAALVYAGRRIAPETRRVLVDAALLTPLMFLR